MRLFRKKKVEIRQEEAIDGTVIDETAIADPVLRALLGKDEIDRSTVMNIPSVSACINRIGDTVSSLEIKLYRREGEKQEEVTDDPRTVLLNDDTGDTMDGAQFKKAMVTDMFLERGGYAFVNKIGTEVKSIHYVKAERLAFHYNSDPIFKDYQIECNGKNYEGWKWIKLLRNTDNGFYGKSIIEESKELLGILRATQRFEKNMVKTGGNKKGFVKATKKLSQEAMNALKSAFRKLYSNNSENVVILNDGLDFKESSNSSVELQLNQNKETNSDDICKIFLVPPTMIKGGASEEDEKLYREGCILPILRRFEKAVNSVLLSEKEKGKYIFAFDTSDFLKADIETRFKAYETALSNGFMQLDEVRKNEKLPEFGLDFIKLGLQDVLYYPGTKTIYTPNTNKISAVGESSDSAEEGEGALEGALEEIENASIENKPRQKEGEEGEKKDEN